MRARKHIFMDAQNSLIVDMEAVRTIIKMKQIGLIGGKMTMRALVLQKMVLNMGSILKLSTLLQNIMCLQDMYIHHFGDFRYVFNFFLRIF
jgi:hypothetical protein